jgi:hypothetical protein
VKTSEPSAEKIVDESPDGESDEVLDISEETNWDKSKMNISFPNIREDKESLCWPKDWLSKDVPTSHVRMLAVDYESRVSEWQIQSMPRNVIRRSMHDRAQEIAEQLKQAGVGKRPIIWVKYSQRNLFRFQKFSGRTFNGWIINQIYFNK